MRTPADSRADAQRLIQALPRPLPTNNALRANAAHRALQDSGLLDRNNRASGTAIAAAIHDGLSSLAHLLDNDAPGHGAGQLLLLVHSHREAYTPHPAPDQGQILARDTAAALLNLALWHADDPQRLLDHALRAHAEEARSHDHGTGEA